VARIHVSEDRKIGAPAEAVYSYIADHEQHQRFLPPAFSEFKIESDTESDLVTRWTVTREGGACNVEISTSWESEGIVGFFERLVAPRPMRRIYAEELQLLDAYARRREQGDQDIEARLP
jgi:ribosome-associated toxin RatA of RatAB toxin-antitoxin module